MVTKILIIGVLLIAILIVLRLIHKLYPIDSLIADREVSIYMDNRHNRTASISHNYPNFIVIYGKLPLPVHYRGRFYAIGYMDDGHTLMFIGRRKLYFLARVAEVIRKIVGTPAYQDPAIEHELELEKTETPAEDKESEG